MNAKTLLVITLYSPPLATAASSSKQSSCGTRLLDRAQVLSNQSAEGNTHDKLRLIFSSFPLVICYLLLLSDCTCRLETIYEYKFRGNQSVILPNRPIVWCCCGGDYSKVPWRKLQVDCYPKYAVAGKWQAFQGRHFYYAQASSSSCTQPRRFHSWWLLAFSNELQSYLEARIYWHRNRRMRYKAF